MQLSCRYLQGTGKLNPPHTSHTTVPLHTSLQEPKMQPGKLLFRVQEDSWIQSFVWEKGISSWNVSMKLLAFPHKILIEAARMGNTVFLLCEKEKLIFDCIKRGCDSEVEHLARKTCAGASSAWNAWWLCKYSPCLQQFSPTEANVLHLQLNIQICVALEQLFHPVT